MPFLPPNQQRQSTEGIGLSVGSKFFAAIAGFAKFMKLTYHRELLCFAAKRREFDYFYTIAAKYQHRSI